MWLLGRHFAAQRVLHPVSHCCPPPPPLLFRAQDGRAQGPGPLSGWALILWVFWDLPSFPSSLPQENGPLHSSLPFPLPKNVLRRMVVEAWGREGWENMGRGWEKIPSGAAGAEGILLRGSRGCW